ncbi:MAG: FAD-binding protein [Betaproteobacteria bacterium]|nr:MAG: FAD-binding protein [Betaproteobacteria bacterium]
MRELRAEALVIGGGAAGTYAALCLHRQGVAPLVISKGLVGKSGASIFAGNLVISGRVLGNTEENARDTAEFLIKYHNQFLIDQEYAKRCGQWIAEVYYPELEEAGLYLRRDDAGNVVTSPGRLRSVAANVQGNSGVPFMDLRRKQLIRAGIPMLEEVVVTALLQAESGEVCGVLALDIASGEIFCVRAKAVVLATGYADRLHRRSTGTREMSADGIALGWRAGAELVNLEMQWWHTNDVRYPANWQRMQVYPNPMLGSWKSARNVNAKGEVFFDQQEDDPLAFGPYTVQLKRLVKQVREGKARYDGDYYSGFDHVDPAEVDAYTTYAKLFKQLGLDVGRDLVETAVSAHYRQGGLLVDPATMASTVPGLFVAGGVGGHSNGLIALVTYDGKVAADSVAQHVRDRPYASLPPHKAEEEAKRLQGLLKPGATPPVRVKKMIRELMWNDMGVEKNEAGMRRALEGLQEIRAAVLPAMGVTNLTKIMNHGWLDAIDAVNMVEACELMVHSALNRTESRGPFIRTDYPEMDNESWLAQNILVPTADGGFRFEKRPYATPYFQPEFVRKDNLAVQW